jgi:ubiquinone/menaquinone biosynthesis C-methylase UbiE
VRHPPGGGDVCSFARSRNEMLNAEILRYMFEAGGWVKESRIADLGGGAGHDAAQVFAETGATVLCVDRVAERTWQRRCGRVLFVVGDALWLPFKSDSLDGVFMACLYHLVDNKGCLLSEVYRSLLSGGNLFIVTVSEVQLKRRFLNRYFPSIEHIDLARYGTIADLNKLARSAGFQSVETRSIVLREEMPTDDFFDVIRKKRWSSLHRISAKEYKEGLRRLETDSRRWSGMRMPSWRNWRSVVWLRKAGAPCELDLVDRI